MELKENNQDTILNALHVLLDDQEDEQDEAIPVLQFVAQHSTSFNMDCFQTQFAAMLESQTTPIKTKNAILSIQTAQSINKTPEPVQ